MEIYNLYALAEDHRIAREREARFERLRRRRPRRDDEARPVAKPAVPRPAFSRNGR
jgi:hypothetical protein